MGTPSPENQLPSVPPSSFSFLLSPTLSFLALSPLPPFLPPFSPPLLFLPYWPLPSAITLNSEVFLSLVLLCTYCSTPAVMNWSNFTLERTFNSAWKYFGLPCWGREGRSLSSCTGQGCSHRSCGA